MSLPSVRRTVFACCAGSVLSLSAGAALAGAPTPPVWQEIAVNHPTPKDPFTERPGWAPPNETTTSFGDQKYFLLVEPLTWVIGKTTTSVTVPAGFVTDLTSIPKALWGPPFYLTPEGQYGRAAIVHDYLYWSQKCQRAQADALFAIAAQESGVSTDVALSMYDALRAFGQSAWDDDNAKLTSGFPTVLPRDRWTRPDPNQSWPAYASQLVAQGVRAPDVPDAGNYCALGNSTTVP